MPAFWPVNAMDTPNPAVAVGRQSERRNVRKFTPRPALRIIPPKDFDPADLKNPALYINRELSWLAFNERVLAQARDAHPLLERVKFLAITGTNLDEFFMIRVSTTQKKLQEGIEDIAPDGFNTEQQLEAMRQGARAMLETQAGNRDLAIRYYAEALTLDPNHASARQGLAAIQSASRQ